ncbi:MAG: 30S ribosomal protein S16 [Chitinophagaceae bacterium]|nr:30S ribosomal protein S16 [Chitinophagaceae bacterium]
MPIKIRLQRHGAKKRPFYFIVVANSTSPRDGKFIEKLGTYNPLTVPATIEVNRERSLYWINQGAEATHTAKRILSFKGVLYLKHLMRGVKLGLFDEATAYEKFEKWNGGHEEIVAKRQEQHKKAKLDAIVKPIIKEVVAEVPVVAEVVAEEAPAVEETPVAEETPVVAETTVEETPATESTAEETPSEEPTA